MLNYHANGKLLLTGEYAITQGAKGLAVPTRFGQSLNYKIDPSYDCITWNAVSNHGERWFWVKLNLGLQILDASDIEVASKLVPMLKVVKTNTALLDKPCLLTTTLEFPREWGLGTSSTLVSLLAQMAGINPYSELGELHNGSGYDIACATAQQPIIYHLENGEPQLRPVDLKFEFAHDIGLVYSGRKQSTAQSLKLLGAKPFSQSQILEVDALTEAFLNAQTIMDLENVIEAHEQLISDHLKITKVGDTIFKGFPGKVKSLGGWGGDFVLITRLAASKKWLRNHNFKVVFPFKSLTL